MCLQSETVFDHSSWSSGVPLLSTAVAFPDNNCAPKTVHAFYVKEKRRAAGTGTRK